MLKFSMYLQLFENNCTCEKRKTNIANTKYHSEQTTNWQNKFVRSKYCMTKLKKATKKGT